MTEPCNRCFYGAPVLMGDGYELMEACTYVLHTGRHRPCPPGAGCTVFRPDPQERGKGRDDDDQ